MCLGDWSSVLPSGRDNLEAPAEATEGINLRRVREEFVMAVKVVLEPELEIQVSGKSWAYRRHLSRVYARWSRQLSVSSWILQQVEQPKPRPRLKAYPRKKLERN